VLTGTARAVRDAGLRPGRDVRLVTVSIDPRDDPASAAERRRDVVAVFGGALPARAWPYLGGDAAGVRRLADAVGFRFAFDRTTDQYAHPAVLIALTPDGRVSSYLYGVAFDAGALRGAVARAGAGGIAAVEEPLLLRCYRYVPALRRFAGPLTAYLRVAGALSVVSVLAAAALAIRGRRRAGAAG
jgi:protein SCO1/2